ncbi:MAG: radical SAM protein, partial [Dehalococcoidia bacterium]
MEDSSYIYQYNPWEYTPPGEKGELLYLSIAVTTTCNFHCSFCSKAGQEPVHLDSKLLHSVLQEAIDLGLKKVECTGGEPLLYPGILDLIEELSGKRVT